MEFSFEPVCDQLRAGSSYLDVAIARTCWKLVADRIEAKFYYAILLVADRFEAGSKLVADRFESASNLSMRPASKLLRSSFEPASNQIA